VNAGDSKPLTPEEEAYNSLENDLIDAVRERDEMRRIVARLIEVVLWHDRDEYAEDPDSETYRRIEEARAALAWK